MRVTVREHHHAVLFKDGKYKATLEPGRYWYWERRLRTYAIDMRRHTTTVPAQELLTSDGIGLKVSAVLEWQVADAKVYTEASDDPIGAIYVACQLALRDVLVSRDFDAVMNDRGSLGPDLVAALRPSVADLGITVLRHELKDLMLPGDLKRIYAQVAEAKQQGLADLERARAQVASLRALANSAKMLKDNPELVKARLLDVMETTKGNTFVLGPDALDLSSHR